MRAAAARMNRRSRRIEQGKGPRIGLTAEQVADRKQRLRGIGREVDADGLPRHAPVEDSQGRPQTFAASEPWIDAVLPVVTDTTPDGQPLSYHLYSPAAVPAGFVRCRRCGHQSPPICVSAKGFCIDCRYYELDRGQHRLQGSTSSVSMKRIKQARADGEEVTPGGM